MDLRGEEGNFRSQIPGDGSNVYQPFRFPGQYEDPETGLYYNYFRDYDPVIGRYLEADPIGQAGGLDIFAYAENGPSVYFDPLGLSACNEYLINGFRTGRIDWEGYNNCMYSRELKPATIMAAATFGDCVKCETTCLGKAIVGSAAMDVGLRTAEKALEKTLKNKAADYARQYAKKAIPIVGQVDTVITAYGMATCTTNCLVSTIKALE